MNRPIISSYRLITVSIFVWRWHRIGGLWNVSQTSYDFRSLFCYVELEKCDFYYWIVVSQTQYLNALPFIQPLVRASIVIGIYTNLLWVFVFFPRFVLSLRRNLPELVFSKLISVFLVSTDFYRLISVFSTQESKTS